MAAVDAQAVAAAATGAGQAVGVEQGDELARSRPARPSGGSGGSPSLSFPVAAGDSLVSATDLIACQEAEHQLGLMSRGG